MNIRHEYNEALNKLEADVNDGLRDLIKIIVWLLILLTTTLLTAIDLCDRDGK
jgi:hypothetical protein